MSTKAVYDYVMNTPKNTNPAVLSSMLGHLSWNDLKDKPFYTEIIPTVVLNETLDYNGYEEWYQGGFKGNDLTFTQVGDTYIVQINNGASQEYVLDESMTATYTNATTGKVYNLDFGVEWVGGIVITAADGTTDPIAVKVVKLIEEVHKINAKYLYDPYWVEEKRVLVAEGVPDENSCYRVDFQDFKKGEGYTYYIDGVKYTDVSFYNDSLECHTVEFRNVYGNLIAYAYATTVILYSPLDVTVSHKIERAEYITHKLDAKYLPDPDMILEVDGSFDIDLDESRVTIASGNYRNVADKITSGKVVDVRVRERRSGGMATCNEIKARCSHYDTQLYISFLCTDSFGNIITKVIQVTKSNAIHSIRNGKINI